MIITVCGLIAALKFKDSTLFLISAIIGLFEIMLEVIGILGYLGVNI